MELITVYKVKNAILRNAELLEGVHKETARALLRVGAHVRTSARSRLRRRKKTSSPGESPSVHSPGNTGLKRVFFALENDGLSIVIGPEKLNKVVIDGGGNSIRVPQLMEFGGTAIIEEESFDGRRWYRRDLRYGRRKYKQYRKRAAEYEPRPFMAPALEANVNKMPQQFVGLITA